MLLNVVISELNLAVARAANGETASTLRAAVIQAQADLQFDGQKKQRDAQRLSDDLQQEFDRDRQDILAKAAQKMQTVVKKLAEDKGYDVVVDVSQMLYFKPTLDITPDALAAYNKTYPAK